MLIVAGMCPQGPSGPPPPLLPKPGKDNLRLQKLLRKAARKKMTGGGPPTPLGAFRTSLSPVSEANHDQEPTAPRPAEAPRPVATLPRSPRSSIIHHVASPLQKSVFPFSFTQCRSLAAHFKATGPQLVTPTLDPTQAPSGFTQVSAPAAGVTHVSHVHIRLVPSPQAGTPEPCQTAPDQGPGGQDPGMTPCPPGAQPPGPTAHTHSLPPEAQAVCRRPEAPPGSETSVSREAGTQPVVPVAPAYRSPEPSPHRPASEAPKAEHWEEPPMAGPTTEAELVSRPHGASSPAPLSGPHPCPVPKVAPKPRLSGWTRLKKQLMEEAEVSSFPGPEQSPEHGEQEVTAPMGLVSRPPRLQGFQDVGRGAVSHVGGQVPEQPGWAWGGGWNPDSPGPPALPVQATIQRPEAARGQPALPYGPLHPRSDLQAQELQPDGGWLEAPMSDPGSTRAQDHGVDGRERGSSWEAMATKEDTRAPQMLGSQGGR